MIVRQFQPADDPVLREIHARGDYGFDFPDVSDYLVVTDDLGAPIMAAGYKLVPEVTMLCSPGGSVHPLVKLEAIRLLHKALRDKLVSKGFKQAFSFLAPKSERAFARHLRRHFGWIRTWSAYAISLGGSDA